MYTLLIIFYIGGIAYFAKRVWQSIQKGGPMHEVSYQPMQHFKFGRVIHFGNW